MRQPPEPVTPQGPPRPPHRLRRRLAAGLLPLARTTVFACVTAGSASATTGLPMPLPIPIDLPPLPAAPSPPALPAPIPPLPAPALPVPAAGSRNDARSPVTRHRGSVRAGERVRQRRRHYSAAGPANCSGTQTSTSGSVTRRGLVDVSPPCRPTCAASASASSAPVLDPKLRLHAVRDRRWRRRWSARDQPERPAGRVRGRRRSARRRDERQVRQLDHQRQPRRQHRRGQWRRWQRSAAGRQLGAATAARSSPTRPALVAAVPGDLAHGSLAFTGGNPLLTGLLGIGLAGAGA